MSRASPFDLPFSSPEERVRVDAELERLGLSWLPARGTRCRITAARRELSGRGGHGNGGGVGVATGVVGVFLSGEEMRDP